MSCKTHQFCNRCRRTTEHILQCENDPWAECIECLQKETNYIEAPKPSWELKYTLLEILRGIIFLALLVGALTWPLVIVGTYVSVSYLSTGYVIIASRGFGFFEGLHLWFYAPLYFPLILTARPLI